MITLYKFPVPQLNLFKKNLFSLLIVLFVSFQLKAQTVLISPTGDGGFENGATFAANGWTEVNGAATNQWFVGTPSTPSAGTNAAFISNNSGVGNLYTITSASTVHFYRDVTFPAGETTITLTFKWKAQGESSYDYITVYSMPTSQTPSANSPTGGFQSWLNIPTIYSGAVVHSTPPNLNLQTTYQTQTICFPPSYAGTTRRLVFMWSNDGSGGTTPPGSIDEISLVSSLYTGPVDQATSLGLTATSNSQIDGSFTAASSAPAGYLVVRYPAGATTTNPVAGATYTAGNSLGLGKVVSAGATTTFSATGLIPNTSYDYYIYSYNPNSCGLIFYNTTTPLFGNISTLPCNPISGTFSVGPTGNYASITSALAAISNGSTGTTIFELQSTYSSSVETFPITFPTFACNVNSVTFRPETGATGLSITSSNATGTINFNGATNITFDGRAGGTGSSQLTISNTSTTGYAIQFINGAQNINLKYCTVSGVNTSTTSGVIVFGNAVGLTIGNSNNTIDNCDIKDGATTPSNLIFVSGNTADYASHNLNNTISNSILHDWFNAASTASSSAAINIIGGASDWTITGNSFYQSVSRTFTMTSATDQGALFVASTTFGKNFTITNNYFGGSAASCGGSAWTYTGGATGTPTIRMLRFTTAIGDFSNISGNTFANISITTASTSTAHSLISHLNGNVNINNNTIGSQSTTGNITFVFTGTSTSLFFLPIGVGTGASASAINITNNSIGGITVSTSSTGTVSFRLIYAQPPVGSVVNVTNNLVGGTVANSIQQLTNNILVGIMILNPSVGNTISNNTIRNFTLNNTGVTGSIRGIDVQASGGNHTITGNSISNLTCNSTNVAINNAASIVGIVQTGILVGGTNVSNNTIFNLTNTNTTVAGWISGMYFSTSLYPQAITTISNNIIHSFNLASATAGMAGIFLPNTGNANVFNNNIRLGVDATGAAITTSLQINGIYKVSTGSMSIYNNSVFIGGTSVVSGAVNTYAFRRAASGPADTVVNNIFYNSRSNTSGTGKHYAINLNANTGIISNANDLFVDGTGGVLGISVATDYSTLATWYAGTSQDGGSVSGDPKFIAPNGSTATLDLHINASSTTVIEKNGMSLPLLTTDIDGQNRSSLTPNDIGSDAGNFTGSDLTGPVISFTPLIYTCNTGDRTLSGVNISDLSGVPTTGSLRPRIYYKKNAGSYFSQPGTFTSGSATNGTWSFTIVASDMGGLTATDIVSYYIIAQDIAGPFISSNAPGVIASDVNTVSTAPVTPNTFSIVNSLISSGTYSVGLGQTFATLTAAVAAYNSSCLTGPVVFSLTDATYSTSETFPIVITANPYASSTNTLTITPTVSTTLITGTSASGMIVLNGADWVIIDGAVTSLSNSVCPPVASSRNLTIVNTSTTTTNAVVWLQTNPTNVFDAATNNTIKNTNIEGSGNTQTLIGIGCGSSTIAITSLGTANNNNKYINNLVRKTQYGIYSQGIGLGAKNNGTVISQNQINTASPDNVSRGGILVGFENNILISGNNISEMALASSPDVFGISMGGISISSSTFTGNEVTNAVVTKNIIGSIRNTGTFSACGIFLAPAISGTNLISNNTVSRVSANNTSGDISVGILVGGGVGSNTQILNNTVTMTSAVANTGSSDKSYALLVGGVNPLVTVRNNIFYNTQSNGTGNSYAVVYGFSPYANLTADHNDLFVGTGSTFFIGGTSSSSAPVNQLTLSNFQTVTGKESASQNISPVFNSGTDLHLSTASVTNWCFNNTGVSVGSVTDDIDCQSRGASPDLGADEFTPTGLVITNPSPVCTPNTVDITAAAVTAGSGSGISFTYWNDLNASSALNNPNAVGTSGIYYIKATDVQGCGFVLPVTVTVNITPAAPTVTAAISYCNNATASQLTASAVSGNTLKWYALASGGTGSTTAPTPSTAAVGTINYYVSQTSPAGCESPRAVIAVTINPLAALPSVVTPVTYCQNATASPLSATAASGHTLNWYTVSSGGTPSSTPITPSTTSFGTFTYYVSQTTSLGCEGARAPIQVIVTPVTAITTQPTDISQCGGTSATFSVTAIGTGTIGYQWYKDGNPISGANSSTFNIPAIAFADSGLYSVIISSSCGSNVTSNNAKLSIASVVPTITPASALVCAGGTVTLQASPIGSNVISYQWMYNGNNISGATNSTLVVSSANQGNYTVLANYVGGCSNTSAVATVSLASTPTANYSISNNVQCLNGNNFSFTNSSSISTGSMTYLWNFGDGTTSTATNATKTYAAFGTYNVKLIVTSNNGCIDSITKLVSVNPKPTPSFTINGASQCLASNAYVFTNTSTVSSGSISYAWTFGDGGTSTLTSPSKVYAAAGTYSVKLVVTSNFGCKDSVIQTVTVNANPAPATPSGATTVCSNVNAVSSTAVSYTSTLISGLNYTWTVTGGTFSGSSTGLNLNTVSVLWGAAGTGSITVTATNTTTNCSGSATLSGIVINPSPTAVVAGSSVPCLNSTGTYSLSNTTGGTITGYNWTVTGGNIVTGQGTANISVTWPSTGAKTIRCTLTNSNGCTGNTPLFNATVGALPTAVFTGATTVCINTPYVYTANSTGNTYVWTATNGTISSQSGNTVTIVWNNSSNTSLQLTETFANGCNFSTSQSITVTGPITGNITGALQACINSNQAYSLNSTATATSWSVTGGNITASTGTTANITWTTTGIQTLTANYTNGACNYTYTLSVNVNALPTPVVTGPNTTCTGTNATYSTPGTAGRAYVWTITGGGNIISGQGTNSITVFWSTTGGTTVNVNETIIATGCAVTSGSLIGVVLATPTSTITGSANACSSSTFTYTASAATTYSWSVTGGTISGSATGSTVNVVWGAAGTGTITLVSANGICTTSSTLPVAINATPAPVITGPNAICSGTATTFAATFNANHNYTWTVINGTYTAGGNGSVINVTPNTGATSVTISVTANVNGSTCSGTATKVLNVNVTPSVSITGNNVACQNSSQVYTGLGAASYTFSVTGGVITSTTATTATVTWGASNGTISAIGTNVSGCSSSAQLAVTVNSLPSSVISGSAQVCANNSSTYNVVAQSGASYAWTVTGGTISGAANSNTVNVNWGAAGAGTVNVTVTSSLGCISNRTMNVNINIQPTPSITGPATVCQNTNQTYTIAAISGAAYNWTVTGGNIVSGSGTNSITVNWTTVGTGSIKVSQSNGSCVGSGNTSVVVNAAPAIPVVYKVGNTLSTTATATSYQWFNNGTIVSGATSQTYTAIAPGTYTLVVTNALGCATSSTGVIANVGVKNNANITNVMVYPNPATNVITIAASLGKSQDVTLNIFDMNGKLVYTISQINADANYSKSISLDGLASGVYMVQLVTNNGSVQQRIVKE